MKTLFTSLCILLLALNITAMAQRHAPHAAANALVPNLSIYVAQRVFPPNKPMTASLSTFNLKQATLAVFRTEIKEVVPNAAVIYAGDNPANPIGVPHRLRAMKLGTPHKRWPVVVKDSYQNSWREQQVKLPKLPSGVYILQARSGKVTARTWFAVSTQALVVKRSPDVLKAWLVTTESGQPVANASIVLYDEHGPLRTERTESDGIATFPATQREQKLWLASRGGEPAFSRAAAPEDEKPYAVYMYSDRPIYRPGQLVRFRGTVRAVHRGAYSLPKEQSVQVQIRARGDALVYDEKLPLSAFGSFSGDFQLAPEPPLGTYSLEVALSPDDREYYSFEVQAYRKPEFNVTVSVPQSHYLGGTTLPTTIVANYFFGSPVAGGKVKYTVHFEQSGSAVPAQILTAAGLGSAAQGTIEEGFSGQGQLNAQGKLELQIPTRNLPFDRQVIVQAEVTDLSLRMRSNNTSVLIAAAQFRLALNLDKQQYQPGDSVEVTAQTLTYDGKPVQVPVTITLIEQLIDRNKRPYEVRTKKAVTTGKDGQGSVRFKVARPGDFHLQAWSRDSLGNAVYAEDEFSVVKELPIPNWPTLETSFDKDKYAPGETALLHVRTTLVGSSALLTIEGERLYRAAVYPLAGKDFVIKVPVIREYQPGVKVNLLVINQGQKVSTDADLSAPMTQKALASNSLRIKALINPGKPPATILPCAMPAAMGCPQNSVWAWSTPRFTPSCRMTHPVHTMSSGSRRSIGWRRITRWRQPIRVGDISMYRRWRHRPPRLLIFACAKCSSIPPSGRPRCSPIATGMRR